MPGTRVDIGDGYELHYYCRGEGSHTILIDAGLSGGSYDFEKIQEDLSDVAKVCVFDRGGYGWSDHIPGPRTSKQIVSEMHAMLHSVPELKPPVILAGHSFGGQNVRLYASTYPEDVEALVLIDALNTDVYDGPPTSNMPWHFHVLNATHWLGLQRFFLGMVFSGDEPEVVRRRQMLSRSKTTTAIYRELKGQGESPVRDSMRHLGTKPVLVFSAGDRTKVRVTANDRWLNGQEALVNISDNTRRIVVDGAGHDIQADDPDFLVQEIRKFLEEMPASEMLPHDGSKTIASPNP